MWWRLVACKLSVLNRSRQTLHTCASRCEPVETDEASAISIVIVTGLTVDSEPAEQSKCDKNIGGRFYSSQTSKKENPQRKVLNMCLMLATRYTGTAKWPSRRRIINWVHSRRKHCICLV